MSPVRILALLGLALMLAGLATGAAAPDGRIYAWLTGQCFSNAPPLVCHRSAHFGGRHYDI